jgi:PKD repeat protein
MFTAIFGGDYAKMKDCKVFFACLLPLVLGVSVTLAQQAPAYKEGELLIKLRPRISSQAAAVSHATLGSRVVKHFRKAGVQLVKLRAGLATKEALELYNNDPNVEYAEPNYRLHALDLFPNDPFFSTLWGLHNTGQIGGTPDADVDAPEAWQMTTGSSDVIVAVIDTGVDYNHEDLSANMWVNELERDGSPWVDDDGNGYIDDIYGIDAHNHDTDPMDDEGHGTHCSGTIGAVGNNGIGVVGVNWNVKIMALKFVGTEGYGWTADAIECLQYAIMMKQNHGHNVRIASNSWGGEALSQALYDTIQAAGNADILFVATAGNDSVDTDVEPRYPSSYALPSIVAVAATDRNDNLASFSNWGPTSVDVAAPGVDVLSSAPGNSYGYSSGTSMAGPHVSGLAALILSQHPEFSWDQVKWNILLAADPLPSLRGLVLTGGRVNAKIALTCGPEHLHLLALSPSVQFELLQNGQTVVRAMVGTCEGPVSDATVTVDFDNGEPGLTLYDNGADPDMVTGDGEYAAFWTPHALGDVTLTITASALGGDPVSKQVAGTVAYLVADFAAEPTNGISPLTVQFTDLSERNEAIGSWLWDFGDGGTSTAANPSHAYNTGGSFTVSLGVTGADGSDTETKTDYVQVMEVGPTISRQTAPCRVIVGLSNPSGNLMNLGTDQTKITYYDPPTGTAFGVYGVVDLVASQGAYTATKYTKWTSHNIKFRVSSFFKDFVQDEDHPLESRDFLRSRGPGYTGPPPAGETGSHPDPPELYTGDNLCNGMNPGVYSVYFRWVFFEDTDKSYDGVNDNTAFTFGDTLQAVTTSNVQYLELTNEPFISKLNADQVMLYVDTPAPNTWNKPRLVITGLNFGPQQTTGEVWIGTKAQYNKGVPIGGKKQTRIRQWSDTKIIIKVKGPPAWRGKTKVVWVVKDGVVSYPARTLKILP